LILVHSLRPSPGRDSPQTRTPDREWMSMRAFQPTPVQTLPTDTGPRPARTAQSRPCRTRPAAVHTVRPGGLALFLLAVTVVWPGTDWWSGPGCQNSGCWSGPTVRPNTIAPRWRRLPGSHAAAAGRRRRERSGRRVRTPAGGSEAVRGPCRLGVCHATARAWRPMGRQASTPPCAAVRRR
jgi:hypothetical protein